MAKARPATEAWQMVSAMCLWEKSVLLIRYRQGVTWWLFSVWGGFCLWYMTQESCVCLHECVHVCLYAFSCAVIVLLLEVGVASLCGTRSREQVGYGWSRESVLIVFVPQSCFAVVKAHSTSWEANCSIYTGRRFLSLGFNLSVHLFIYLFLRKNM